MAEIKEGGQSLEQVIWDRLDKMDVALGRIAHQRVMAQQNLNATLEQLGGRGISMPQDRPATDEPQPRLTLISRVELKMDALVDNLALLDSYMEHIVEQSHALHAAIFDAETTRVVPNTGVAATAYTMRHY